ncbi:MAG: DUF2283 domain-containing protein [Thermoproteota archaeon]
MASVSFDQEARALYIKLDNNKIAKTIPLGDDRFIDVDESGRAVGFEILLPKNIPSEITDVIKRSKSIEILH